LKWFRIIDTVYKGLEVKHPRSAGVSTVKEFVQRVKADKIPDMKWDDAVGLR
jgi:hypothetical protein